MDSETAGFEVKRLGAALSNWGRWGAADQRGTVNFITPETRRAAASMVRSGDVLDLGMEFGVNGPQSGSARFNPIHSMRMLPSDRVLSDAGLVVADDVVTMPLQCATQWDGLAHVGYDGLLYNNVPASVVTASDGAPRNSIEHVVPHLIGRGVLLDVAGFRGVECLSATDEVTSDDLEAAAATQGVSLSSGDVVLVRTGWYQQFLAGDHAAFVGWKQPGLGMSTATWLHDHEVAAICVDNFAVECLPAKEPGTMLPLHMVLIRDLGMTLGEMFNLEELAVACRREGRWAFLFSGIGLKFTAAVGTPVSPVVVL
jgi:kynurenine formamidase